MRIEKETIEEEVEVTLTSKPKTHTKGKVGRPATTDPKNKSILSNFTQSEHDELKELAEEKGYSLSNLLRMAALDLLK